MAKGIMFLSIMDFTDKGIQSVRLTPEYFAKQGWNVQYVVTRDYSKNGSYHYQPEIIPKGVSVHRSRMPSCWVGEHLKSHLLRVIYSQLRGYGSIIKLVWIGQKVIRTNRIDIIYGGGPQGVIAAQVLRLVYSHRNLITVARFYGVWDLYTEMIVGKKWFRLLLNFEVCTALFIRSGLKIITNDGTQGDKALSCIRSSNTESLRFYVNGVDDCPINPSDSIRLRESLQIGDAFTAVCVTRLVPSKRVDLCIRVTATMINAYGVWNFKLVVIGDGTERERLQQLAGGLCVSDHVTFVGAVDNQCVKDYLAVADIFLSTYRISNVGNPLLEAIRANKIILTLNNGDTSAWIKHRENGFIYDDDETMVDRMARDIVELISNPALRDKIKKNIEITEKEKLWTWQQRMQAEFSEINSLVESKDPS